MLSSSLLQTDFTGGWGSWCGWKRTGLGYGGGVGWIVGEALLRDDRCREAGGAGEGVAEWLGSLFSYCYHSSSLRTAFRDQDFKSRGGGPLAGKS